MPILRAKNFKGYSSKSDDLIDHPEYAADCNNVVIHKGDICNIPPIVDVVPYYNLKETLISSYIDFNGENILVIFEENKVYAFSEDDYSIRGEIDMSVFFQQGLKLNSQSDIDSLYKDYVNNISLGKTIQLGSWLYVYFNSDPENSVKTIHRMLRFHLYKHSTGIIIAPMLMGLIPPAMVKYNTTDTGGSMSGSDWAFAFSFSLNTGLSITGDESRIESAAILHTGTIPTLSSNKVKFKVYLEKNISRPDPGPYLGIGDLKIRVYAKQGPTATQYYRGDIVEPDDNEWYEDSENGAFYTNITVDITGFDISEVAPLIGYRFPKKVCHIANYKGRIYGIGLDKKWEAFYVDDSNDLVPLSVDLEVKSNVLQVSQGYNDLYINDPYVISFPDRAVTRAWQYPNYNDDTLNQPIGSNNQAGTGVIEFYEQLIIFKEDATYVLDDDIVTGDIKKLFNIGCIGLYGAKGYAVVDGKLYWLSKEGVWVFTGSDQPVLISGAIEEDLAELDKTYPYISADEKHKLLYVTFLGQGITFIYHYEIGAWTKADYSIKVVDKKWYNTLDPSNSAEGRIGKVGNINDSIVTNPGSDRFWKTGLLTTGDDIRKKQWKELGIETQMELIDVDPPADKLFIRLYDKDDNIYQALYLSDNNDKIHAGIYSEAISVRVDFPTFRNFRMNGFSLSYMPKGRR